MQEDIVNLKIDVNTLINTFQNIKTIKKTQKKLLHRNKNLYTPYKPKLKKELEKINEKKPILIDTINEIKKINQIRYLKKKQCNNDFKLMK